MELKNEGDYIYKVKRTISERIDNLVKAGRFEDKDDFINRAIDVFFAWETNPAGAQMKMMELDPTLAQYQHMVSMGFPYSELKMMYPMYPEKFGEVWTNLLTEDPTLLKKFEKSKKEQHNPQSDARATPDNYDICISNIRKSKTFLMTRDFSDEKNLPNEYHYDEWPLLFNHYSRIFPARVAILALADCMSSTDKDEVYFEKFTETAYDLCEEIAKKQMQREKENDISRENKTSTGLPKPPEKEDGQTEKEKEKQLEYESRYKEKYFGRVKRSREDGNEYFEGLLSALNLIRTFKKNDELHVTFTKEGRDLFNEDNPTFNGDLSKVFSEKEGIFMLENLFSKRKLEMSLMKCAISLIQSKEGINEEIVSQLDQAFCYEFEEYCKANKKNMHIERLNEIVENHREIMAKREKAKSDKMTESDKVEKEKLDRIIKKQTPIEAIRIGTMGRMAELNLVEWEISEGKSYFKRKNQKLIDIVKAFKKE